MQNVIFERLRKDYRDLPAEVTCRIIKAVEKCKDEADIVEGLMGVISEMSKDILGDEVKAHLEYMLCKCVKVNEFLDKESIEDLTVRMLVDFKQRFQADEKGMQEIEWMIGKHNKKALAEVTEFYQRLELELCLKDDAIH
jgi:hypothetical protein